MHTSPEETEVDMSLVTASDHNSREVEKSYINLAGKIRKLPSAVRFFLQSAVLGGSAKPLALAWLGHVPRLF